MNSAAAAAFEPLSNSLCGFYKGFQQLLSWTEALRGKGVRSSGPSQPHVVPNAPRELLLEIKIKTITIIILRIKLALIIDKAKLFMQYIEDVELAMDFHGLSNQWLFKFII